MKNLLELLGRFSKSLNKDTFTKEVISQIIKDRTRVELSPQNLLIKNGVLHIEATSTAKNEISLKAEEIINDLRTQKIPVSRILYK